MNTSKSTRARLQALSTSTAFVAALILAAPQTVWAGGSNTSSPNTPPVTPQPKVTTVLGNNAQVNGGGCYQSYLATISKFQNGALIANDTAVGLSGVAA